LNANDFQKKQKVISSSSEGIIVVQMGAQHEEVN
jgi:predicted Rossmann fold nucleotide-binding protein DprA/Smf involved in DNA uptake